MHVGLLLGPCTVISTAVLPSLHELADKYGTDKSSRFGHNYVGLYSMLPDSAEASGIP